GAKVISKGAGAVGNGEPATGVSAPVEGSMRYAEIVRETLLDTYANWPDGSTATNVGYAPLPPETKGDPGTAVSDPLLELTLKAEMLSDPALATYKNWPEGEAATL